MFEERYFVKLKKSNIKFLLRLVLIFVILSIFYIKYLLITSDEQNIPIENSSPTFKSGLNLLPLDDFSNNQNGTTSNSTKFSIWALRLDGLTREQRIHGWIILHIVLLFYGFWFLAAITEDYLVPSIQQICSNCNIDVEVIGATIMVTAVSIPECFTNCIGTFITQSDIGLGTIMGSTVFNILAVPASCAVLDYQYTITLEWWPVVRDCCMNLVVVFLLFSFLRDGHVWWYEALALIIIYIGCMLIMYYNKKIYRNVKNLLRRHDLYTSNYKQVNEFSTLLTERSSSACSANDFQECLDLEQHSKEEDIPSPWSFENQNLIEFCFRWPITLLFWMTVPDSRKHNCLKYLTLILSVLWIAAISYFLVLVMTIIGDTLNVPDGVMGLTIFAAGINIPGAVTSIVAITHSDGCTNRCNSLGANKFALLICLGLPWFIKAYFLPDLPDQKLLQLNSSSVINASIMIPIILLLFCLLLLLNKFALNRRVAIACLIIYISWIAIIVLMDFNKIYGILKNITMWQK